MSETFIAAQAKNMFRYDPRFLGLLAAQKTLIAPEAATLLRRKNSSYARLLALLFTATGTAPNFRRAVGELNLALIHAHFAPDGATVLPFCSQLQIPLVVTLHGYDVTMRDTRLANTFTGRTYLRRRRELWERAALFICVSHYMRDRALEAGFPGDKLRVHYIGVEARKAEPVLPGQDKLIVFVGRLVPKKGCMHLLRAMEEVQRREPAARLVVVGEGPLRIELQQYAIAQGIAADFLGAQAPSLAMDWMRKARVLCVPSIEAPDGDNEGLGMVSLEAQSLGKPVVGFRTGGLPETLDEGKTGLLAEPGNEEDLAAHLLRYLSDDQLWRETSARAVEWVQSRFDIHHQTMALEGLYDDILTSAQ